MPNEGKELIEYRLSKLEETQATTAKAVGNIADKQTEQITSFEILKTKIGVYASILAIVLSITVSVATNFINKKVNSFTSKEKAVYYDKRVAESETVKALRLEIERLKAKEK